MGRHLDRLSFEMTAVNGEPALALRAGDTLVTDGHVPDEVYERVKPHFTEEELVDLTLAITNINAWNRLNIALRTVAGNYRPGMYKSLIAAAHAKQ